MNYKFIRTIISRLYHKYFTIVTYNRNDSTLYYKTTLLAKVKLILANLALARSLNYESQGMLQSEAHLMIIIYNRKTFIVQATSICIE
jgi:hypothetical protein